MSSKTQKIFITLFFSLAYWRLAVVILFGVGYVRKKLFGLLGGIILKLPGYSLINTFNAARTKRRKIKSPPILAIVTLMESAFLVICVHGLWRSNLPIPQVYRKPYLKHGGCPSQESDPCLPGQVSDVVVVHQHDAESDRHEIIEDIINRQDECDLLKFLRHKNDEKNNVQQEPCCRHRPQCFGIDVAKPRHRDKIAAENIDERVYADQKQVPAINLLSWLLKLVLPPLFPLFCHEQIRSGSVFKDCDCRWFLAASPLRIAVRRHLQTGQTELSLP